MKPLSRTRTICVALSLAAMLYASPAMVLCVGADGHVAIEPVGRCSTDACPPHADGSPPERQAMAAQPVGCGPCTDIPIPLEIGPGRGRPDRVKAVSECGIVPLVAATRPDNTADLAVLSHWELSISYHTPLRTIVLLI